MPKLKSSVPKYRKHKQSGQAITTINGRDHLLGPHGTRASKFEYDRLIAEWLASGRSSSYGAPQYDLTVVELAADYLKYAKGYYGASVRGSYATMVNAIRPLNRLYGMTTAAEFAVVQFKAVRQSLLAKDLSRTYINEIMRRIVAVFRWGAAEGRIPASVPQNLGIIPGLRKGRSDARETMPIKPVASAVVEATLAHVSPIVAAMIRLQMLTGARPGEICNLTPGVVEGLHHLIDGAHLAAAVDLPHFREHAHGDVLRVDIEPDVEHKSLLSQWQLKPQSWPLHYRTDRGFLHRFTQSPDVLAAK